MRKKPKIGSNVQCTSKGLGNGTGTRTSISLQFIFLTDLLQLLTADIKMPLWCAVATCKSWSGGKSRKKIPGIIVFVFPSDQKQCDIWKHR